MLFVFAFTLCFCLRLHCWAFSPQVRCWASPATFFLAGPRPQVARSASQAFLPESLLRRTESLLRRTLQRGHCSATQAVCSEALLCIAGSLLPAKWSASQTLALEGTALHCRQSALKHCSATQAVCFQRGGLQRRHLRSRALLCIADSLL